MPINLSRDTMVFPRHKKSTQEVQIELVDVKYCIKQSHNLPGCFEVEPSTRYIFESCPIIITYNGLHPQSTTIPDTLWIKFTDAYSEVDPQNNFVTVTLKFEKEEHNQQKSEGLLECNICLLPYSDEDEELTPRILSGCGHTLCETCVKKLLERSTGRSIECPFDRKKTSKGNLLGTHLDHIPKNYALIEMLQKQKEAEKKKEAEKEKEKGKEMEICEDPIVPCYEDSKHEATCYCINCKEDFCQQCFNSTHSSRILSNHQSVPISEKPLIFPNCPKHPDLVANRLCTEPSCTIDSKLYCAVCSGNDHLHHKSKKVQDIMEKNQKNLETAMNNLKSAKTTIMNKAELAKSCSESFKKTSRDYELAVKEIQDFHQKKQEEDIKKLEEFVDSTKEEFGVEEQEIEHDWGQITRITKEIERTLARKKELLNVEELMDKGQAMCSFKNGNDINYARLNFYTFPEMLNVNNIPSTSGPPNQKRKFNDDKEVRQSKRLKKVPAKNNTPKQN